MANLKTLALAAPLTILAGMTSAATVEPTIFDFGALADELKAENGTELEWGDTIYAQDGWTKNGLTVKASDRAHLDGGFESSKFVSEPSGLGFCNIADCNKSDFDGIREVEDVLVLTFDRIVDVLWTIRETTAAWQNRTGPDHTLAEGCAKVNGVDHDLTGGRFVTAPGASSAFTFQACSGGSSFGMSDYYVTSATIEGTPPSPVPLPAGALLLGTALMGLGLRSRLVG